MSKTAIGLLASVLIGVLLLGGRLEDSRNLAESRNRETSLLADVTPPAPQKKTVTRGPLGDFQGVEVHLPGLVWENRLFQRGRLHGIERVGGIADFDVSQIQFDPDLADAGLPNLVVTVGNPRPFRIDSFLQDMLSFQLADFLGKKLSSDKPIETHTWLVGSGEDQKKVRMDLHLLEFDLAIQIEPSWDKMQGDLPRDPQSNQQIRNHPISNQRLEKREEYRNRRYSSAGIILKFSPNSDVWYFASKEDDALVSDSPPHIGIAAVECFFRKFEGDPDQPDLRFGSSVRQGQPLALYDSMEELTGIASDDRSDSPSDVNAQIAPFERFRADASTVVLNPKLFDRDKYARIRVSNIGSWRKGNFWSGKRRWLDQLTARFVMHTFVVGEWKVKRPDVSGPLVAGDQKVRRTPGLVARIFRALLPDFGLGSLGRAVSAVVLILVSVLILAFFFPPVLRIVNAVFEIIARAIEKRVPPKKPA